jgi:hypothetical protein
MEHAVWGLLLFAILLLCVAKNRHEKPSKQEIQQMLGWPHLSALTVQMLPVFCASANFKTFFGAIPP